MVKLILLSSGCHIPTKYQITYFSADTKDHINMVLCLDVYGIFAIAICIKQDMFPVI